MINSRTVYQGGHQSTKNDLLIWIQIFGKSCHLIALFYPLLKCLHNFCTLNSHLQVTSTALALYDLFNLASRFLPDNLWSSHTIFLACVSLPWSEKINKQKSWWEESVYISHWGKKNIFCQCLLRNLYLTAC